MGQLTMIPKCASSEIKQLCWLGWGGKKSFFRPSLSSFVQKLWVDENASFDNYAAYKPVSPCRPIAMVEMVISTNQKPTIYRNLYENTAPEI